ncbi:hypothetical protein BH09MYX1_BH09MYX1_22270 [soil metagenome]
MSDAATILAARLADTRLGPFDVRCPLEHFLMVTYAVDPAKLSPHYDGERFTLDLVETAEGPRALVSAVSFLDADFRFVLAPFAPMVFGQTNYRFYVKDRATEEHAAWFIGTTLGHDVVHVARALFKLPWHPAEYTFETGRSHDGRYHRFRQIVRSEWGPAFYDVEDTGAPLQLRDAPGYPDHDEMFLRLCHPVTGYFFRTDGGVARYSIWHEKLALRVAKPRALYIGLFDRLGLVREDEMMRPHSVLVASKVLFHIHLPPRRLSET